MAYAVGFRTAAVFTDVPANTEKTIGMQSGNIQLVEVTNKTASDVTIMINDYPENGHPGASIPVMANTTRQIPMQVYKFKASGVVTVVAYGM